MRHLPATRSVPIRTGALRLSVGPFSCFDLICKNQSVSACRCESSPDSSRNLNDADDVVLRCQRVQVSHHVAVAGHGFGECVDCAC